MKLATMDLGISCFAHSLSIVIPFTKLYMF